MSTLAGAIDALVELEATIHPTLHVSRHWRPDLELPALYNHLTRMRPEPTGVGPGCVIHEWWRVNVVIAVDPTATAGEGDWLEVEAYADLALPLLEGAVYASNPLGLREARLEETDTALDTLGSAEVLNLQIAIGLRVDRVPSVQAEP